MHGLIMILYDRHIIYGTGIADMNISLYHLAYTDDVALSKFSLQINTAGSCISTSMICNVESVNIFAED